MSKKKSNGAEVVEQPEVAEEAPEAAGDEAPPAEEAATAAQGAPAESPPAVEAGHDVELKKTRRDITLKLTDHQVAASAKSAADAAYQRALKESELSSIKSRFKAEIETLEADITENLTRVRDGAESKTVDVLDRYDYTDGVVRTFWASELVETRPLTHDERQMGIKFIEKKGKIAAEAQAKEPVDPPADTTDEPGEQASLPLDEAQPSA